MDRVKEIKIENKIILEIDYSDLKEAGMLQVLDEAKTYTMKFQNPFLILSCFNNKNFITPAFLLRAKQVTFDLIHLIEKHAIVGLSFTQKLILKGFNIAIQRNFKAFDTREEAIRFLLDQDTTDKDLPDYFKKKDQL